jgi:hypothetical protein
VARERRLWESRSSRSAEEGPFYSQHLYPVGHSLGLTAVMAALPIVTLTALLGAMRMKAQWAGPIALAAAVAVAAAIYVMPLPDHVDRRRGDLGPQDDRRVRALRRAALRRMVPK